MSGVLDIQLNAYKGLSSGTGLCHPSGMAKTKKNAAAVALGRLGGLKGGKARAKNLTAAQRKASARRAAVARWSKGPKKGRKSS